MSNVEDMSYAFANAFSFNQPLENWDVGQVDSMDWMFASAHSFNRPLDNWDVGNVKSMVEMFFSTSQFNQPLNSWDVSSVKDMSYMFGFTNSFNASVSDWDVSQVTDMHGMFHNAVAFDQSLGEWEPAAVTDVRDLLSYTGLSIENYDSTLIGWSTTSLPGGLTFEAYDIKYCEGHAARQYLMDSLGWSIYDGGPACVLPGKAFITTWLTNAVIENPTDKTLYLGFDGPGTNYSVDWDNDGLLDTTNLTGPITIEFDTTGVYTIQVMGVFPEFDPTISSAEKLLSVDQWGTNAWQSLLFRQCTNLVFNAVDTPDLTGVTSFRNMFDHAINFNSPIGHWDVRQCDGYVGSISMDLFL